LKDNGKDNSCKHFQQIVMEAWFQSEFILHRRSFWSQEIKTIIQKIESGHEKQIKYSLDWHKLPMSTKSMPSGMHSVRIRNMSTNQEYVLGETKR
jgi:hypothetical protein